MYFTRGLLQLGISVECVPRRSQINYNTFVKKNDPRLGRHNWHKQKNTEGHKKPLWTSFEGFVTAELTALLRPKITASLRHLLNFFLPKLSVFDPSCVAFYHVLRHPYASSQPIELTIIWNKCNVFKIYQHWGAEVEHSKVMMNFRYKNLRL